MDRVADISLTVEREVERYAGRSWKAATYAVSDRQRQIYSVVVVPDLPRSFPARIVVMARVVGDTVMIDEDTTDRPLYEELLRAGIPREKIVLLYAGEQPPQPESAT